MAKSDYQLSSDVEIESNTLASLISGSAEDTQIFGRVYMSTTGEFLVPNEWLHDRLAAIGFDEDYIPSQPSDLQAYKRAMKRLIDAEHEEATIEGRRVTFRLAKGDDRERFLRADVYTSREERGTDYGKEDSLTLGTFDYNVEAEPELMGDRLTVIAGSDLENAPALRDSWEMFVNRAFELINKCKTHNTGKDLQNFLGYFNNHWSQAVKVRHGGGVYFIPEKEAAYIEGLAEMYADIDEQFKSAADSAHYVRTEIRTFPVFNDAEGEQSEMIESAVNERLNSMVADAVDEAVKSVEAQLQDGEVVESAVAEAMDGLKDAEFTADMYNNLLDAELTIRRALKERLSGVDPKERKHIEEALHSQYDL